MDKLKKSFAVFAIGFFAIASQTLLFREFISAFESNDIAVGMFFGAWFLWIGVAAWISVRIGNRFAKFADWTPLIILTYLPAFILQYVMILNIRKCAGVEVYELFPIGKMVLWSLAVNAPLSFVTGFVFPLACRWFKEAGKLPVADVYIFESLGSFAGGLAVTVMLVCGFNSFLVFFLISLLLTSSFYLLKLRKYAGLILPLVLVSSIVFRMDVKFIESVRLLKWTRLLPAESYNGAFQTAQSEYLYGSYDGQWTVCREGSACEMMPDPEGAWKIIAIHLAQNPKAEKVLVIGSGMNLCREILRIPQISDVTWSHYDNGYVSEVNKYVPVNLKIADRRFHPIESGDIREFLAKRKNYFDLVIVNVPDVTTSILNRYFTLEFNELVKSSTSANGVMGIRLSGGENVIGPELAFIGASAMETLGKTFSRIEIVPGDTTWFMGSNSTDLSGDPAILVKRFASNKTASAFFPPEGLLSLYIPDRAEIALGKYKSIKVSGTTLLNTDANPPAYLFGLLFSARQSGVGLTSFVEKLLGRGIFFPAIPLAVSVLLLTVCILRNRGERKMQGRVLSVWIIFGAGFVSIGTAIVLMYIFQTCLGSLYLNVGIVSAVFMLGLSLGAALSGYFFNRMKIESGLLLDLAVTLHVTVLFLIFQMSEWTYSYFILAFAMSGICSGLYFPAAAFFLRESGYRELESGGMLETSDHLGAALGAFICGIFIIPVWGVAGTLIFFMIFMLTVIPVSLVCRLGKAAVVKDNLALIYRNVGYFLFGIAITVVIWSDILSITTVSGEPFRHYEKIKPLAEGFRMEILSAHVGQGEPLEYLRLSDKTGKVAGYVFSSDKLAPGIRGYGGELVLGIRVNPAGMLQDFRIIESNEAPDYVDMLSGWAESLKGKNIFSEKGLKGVDTVTGATFSSRAVLEALSKAGDSFSKEVLSDNGRKAGFHLKKGGMFPGWGIIYLICAFVAALIVSFKGGFKSRFAVILLTLSIGGLVLDVQYSTVEIMTLLSFKAAFSLSLIFFLAVIVPAIAVIAGNYYCGYVCPFGALQEVASYILPGRLKPLINDRMMLTGRQVKYVLLFIVSVLYFLSWDNRIALWDPLVCFFSGKINSAAMVAAGIALAGSLFYFRFWCRYLCPAGAFLSLFGSVCLLRRKVPFKIFRNCEMGVRSMREMDCIFCDRCRSEFKPKSECCKITGGESVTSRWLTRIFIYFVILSALLLAGYSTHEFYNSFKSGGGNQPETKQLQLAPSEKKSEKPAVEKSSGAGEEMRPGIPRDVNMDKLNRMLKSGKLSGKEAEYYRKIE